MVRVYGPEHELWQTRERGWLEAGGGPLTAIYGPLRVADIALQQERCRRWLQRNFLGHWIRRRQPMNAW